MTTPTSPTSLDQLFGSRVAVLVPDAVPEEVAAAARQRLERAGYTRYALIDRGSYEHRDASDEPALIATLLAAARKATGRTLVVISARALRLSAGDYLLIHHDHHDHHDHHERGGAAGAPALSGQPGLPGQPELPAPDDGLVELTLDLSPAPVPGAEVVYTRFDHRNGRPFFQIPSAPRTLAIVERDRGVRCNHGYLSKRFPGAQVVRLVLRLGPA